MTLEQKEKALMDYLDTVVHRVVVDQGQCIASCTKSEMRILDILGKRGGPQKMTDLAEQALLSLSTVTGIIDSLVEKKFVQRERSIEDRRVVWVELTEEGLKLYKESQQFRLKLVHEMLTSLNKSEQDNLIALFRKIAERIQLEKKNIVA